MRWSRLTGRPETALGVVVVLSLLTLTAGPARAAGWLSFAPPTGLAQAQYATVELEVVSSGAGGVSGQASCSGVVVSDAPPIVLTARHCFTWDPLPFSDLSTTAYLQQPAGGSIEVPARLLQLGWGPIRSGCTEQPPQRCTSADIAALLLQSPPAGSVPPAAPVSASTPGFLEKVYDIGFPEGEAFPVTKAGHVTVPYEAFLLTDPSMHDVTATDIGGIQPGDSGGPLVDGSGTVVGIAIEGNLASRLSIPFLSVTHYTAAPVVSAILQQALAAAQSLPPTPAAAPPASGGTPVPGPIWSVPASAPHNALLFPCSVGTWSGECSADPGSGLSVVVPPPIGGQLGLAVQAAFVAAGLGGEGPAYAGSGQIGLGGRVLPTLVTVAAADALPYPRLGLPVLAALCPSVLRVTSGSLACVAAMPEAPTWSAPVTTDANSLSTACTIDGRAYGCLVDPASPLSLVGPAAIGTALALQPSITFTLYGVGGFSPAAAGPGAIVVGNAGASSLVTVATGDALAAPVLGWPLLQALCPGDLYIDMAAPALACAPA